MLLTARAYSIMFRSIATDLRKAFAISNRFYRCHICKEKFILKSLLHRD